MGYCERTNVSMQHEIAFIAQLSIDQFTCELAVVVGAGGVLLVGADGRAGRRTGAEACVAEGRADLAGLTAVVHRPLDVQGGRQRGALLRLQGQQSGKEVTFNIQFSAAF